MPVYVYRNGRLIRKPMTSSPPAPAVHSFEAYPSPIDGQPISSLRQRERDLDQSGSYDPRDTPAAFRRAQNVRYRSQSER